MQPDRDNPSVSWRRLLRAFLRSTRAASAVEFALVLPVLLLLLTGVVEFGRFVLIGSRLNVAVHAMAQAASQGSGPMTIANARMILRSSAIVVPDALTEAGRSGVPWTAQMPAAITSVAFTPVTPGCTSGCAYTGKVAWSVGSSPVRRSCGAVVAAPDGALIGDGTLPTSAFGKGTVIVAEARYAFRPLLGSAVLPAMDIRRSAYFVPRDVSSISFTASGTSDQQVCP